MQYQQKERGPNLTRRASDLTLPGKPKPTYLTNWWNSVSLYCLLLLY